MHDARVDHLAAACDIAKPGPLTVDRLKHVLAGTNPDQAFLERPDPRAGSNLAAGAQADKTLEAESIKPCNFTCSTLRLNSCRISRTRTINSVGTVDDYHVLGWRRAAWSTNEANAATSTRCSITPQGVAGLVELRFPLLVGKRTMFEHGNQVRVSLPTSYQNRGGFSRYPK